MCELLVDAGHRLTLVGRRVPKLQETRAALDARTEGAAETLVAVADLGAASAASPVVDATLARWGRVDALVNNAGIAPRAAIAETTDDLLHRTFAVNVFGPAMMIAAVWPTFLDRRAGCIVNVSSLATSDPFPGFFVYGASKSALEGLTRSAANEGVDEGIRAFSVAPGAVETATLRGLFSEDDVPPDQTLPPADVAHVICDCILGRRDRDAGDRIEVVRAGLSDG